MELPAHLEPSSAWREIRVELRRMVGESTYDIWLAPLEVKALDGAVLLLQAPPATQAWVAKRFGRILETCARTVVGAGISVSFVGAGAGAGSGPGERGAPSSRGDHIDVETGLTEFNPRYSFDQFIIGDGNRLAHAAALAVAELPGQAYNPLFLHAPPGLGKTHLLHAIGNYVRRLRRRRDRPLHDGRGLHEPLHQRAGHAARSIVSSAPTAMPTCSSSTTFSSSRAR